MNSGAANEIRLCVEDTFMEAKMIFDKAYDPDYDEEFHSNHTATVTPVMKNKISGRNDKYNLQLLLKTIEGASSISKDIDICWSSYDNPLMIDFLVYGIRIFISALISDNELI